MRAHQRVRRLARLGKPHSEQGQAESTGGPSASRKAGNSRVGRIRGMVTRTASAALQNPAYRPTHHTHTRHANTPWTSRSTRSQHLLPHAFATRPGRTPRPPRALFDPEVPASTLGFLGRKRRLSVVTTPVAGPDIEHTCTTSRSPVVSVRPRRNAWWFTSFGRADASERSERSQHLQPGTYETASHDRVHRGPWSPTQTSGEPEKLSLTTTNCRVRPQD